MTIDSREKWDKAASRYDLFSAYGPEKRWRPHKQRLFSPMTGQILFLAVGTGLDIACFPPGKTIIGIDISPKMLEKAQPRVNAYPGEMKVMVMDVHDMAFADAAFDQAYTSCVFCSVADPLLGLKDIHRVLKPGGVLRMFEHTGSRCFPFNLMLNAMNPIIRRFGPEINRDTTANVKAAGFQVSKVTNLFLDVVKTIEATA